MGRLHYITLLLLIILLAIISGWIFDSMEQKQFNRKEQKQHIPDYFLKNFSATTMNTEGKPAYRSTAALMQHYPDDNSLYFEQPGFQLYENGVPRWQASAQTASGYQGKSQLNLKGKVVLRELVKDKTVQPLRLETEQLLIQTEKQQMSGPEPVRLEKGNNTIRARRMKADLKRDRIEFMGDTRSHYKNIDIRADYLLLDNKKGISQYKGHVHFKKGNLKIVADSITLYIEEEKLKRALITGNPARARQKPEQETELKAQAKQFEYFADTEKLLLRGNAEVDQGNRHFSGKIIEYDSREKRLLASGQSGGKNAEKSSKAASGSRVHVILEEEDNNAEAE